MDAKILGKLARAEEDFVSAMLIGDGELAAYDTVWTSLLDEIAQASASGDISDTTLAIADDVVGRVSTLVECFLSLSSSPPPSYSVPFNPKTYPLLALPTAPPFIPEAYSWLLDNIADPYPSSEFKASLSQRYNSPVSAVSSWFANARRRIGWTALCRAFFSGCRADAVNAARRVLVKGDADHQLGPEVIHAFMAMQVAAGGLYATSAKSFFAGDLDTITKDMQVQDEILARDNRRGEAGMTLSKKCRRKQQSPNPVCYSGLSHSSPPAPCLHDSFPEEGENEETISLSLLAGRKRRSLPSDSYQVTGSAKKRLHLFSPLDPCVSASERSTAKSLESNICEKMTHIPETGNSIVNPQERHPSDPHTAEIPDFSQDSVVEPGLHVVPNSLPPFPSPLESDRSIDEWFNTNFDSLFTLPPPVDVAEPDHSTQLEVELFNYIAPGDLHEAPALPVQDNQISNLIELEDILHSLESGGYVAPQEVTHAPTMLPVLNPVSQNPSLLPDISQPTDWTSFFDTNPFGPACEPIFPQSYVNTALPEIDLFIAQLP